MSNNIIYVETGLGNTIKCMISQLRILEKQGNYNQKLKLYNLKSGFVNNKSIDVKLMNRTPGSISRIFPDIIELGDIKKEKNHKKLRTWRIITFPEDNLKADIFYNYFKDKQSNTSGDIDFLYEKIPKILQNNISKHLKTLRINDHILKSVNDFSKNFFTDKTISVQVNPTRIYSLNHTTKWQLKDFDKHMRTQGSFIYRIVDELKKYDETHNFYVSLSYIPFLDIFINELGKNRIIYTPFVQNRTFDEDMVDMLLLSKNKVIVGTYLSTFCEVAWFFSGCQSKVIIIK